MRTLIAPLPAEVEHELAGIDRRLRSIARRYIRRLALEPYLGYRLQRGRLARENCRAVRFDRGDNPDNLFAGKPHPARPAIRIPIAGPGGGSCTGLARQRTASSGVVVILAVGIAHPQPGHASAVELATRTLQTRIKDVPCRHRR